MAVERTLVLIKPDGVKRAIVGNIITRFENAGLKIIALKMIWVSPNMAKEHYQEHVKKEFYVGLEQFITEGPVVAMVLEGIESIEVVRKIVGSTEPKSAQPGTIRGDFGHISYGYADAKHIAVKNLIHASSNAKDAKREIALWFAPEQIHQYNSIYEQIL